MDIFIYLIRGYKLPRFFRNLFQTWKNPRCIFFFGFHPDSHSELNLKIVLMFLWLWLLHFPLQQFRVSMLVSIDSSINRPSLPLVWLSFKYTPSICLEWIVSTMPWSSFDVFFSTNICPFTKSWCSEVIVLSIWCFILIYEIDNSFQNMNEWLWFVFT